MKTKPGHIAEGYDDQSLIAKLRMPGQWLRRQHAELCLQLPAPYRRDVAADASRGHSHDHGDRDRLLTAVAERVYRHPQWRPVACGARYLPCQVGTTDEWGVIDLRIGDESGGTVCVTDSEWVTDNEGRALRWGAFEDASAAAEQLTNNDRQGQSVGIAQKSWEPSVVRPGDRIKGTCVTNGTPEAGVVLQVVGPIRTPDCGGYRYLIRDDEGREHTVFAELLI